MADPRVHDQTTQGQELREDELLLNRCREAKTLEEQKDRFNEIVLFLETIETRKDGPSCANENYDIPRGVVRIQTRADVLAAHENISRSVLTTWPYGQLSAHIDRIIDACQIDIAISSCSSLLKEISAFGNNKQRDTAHSFSSPTSSIWMPGLSSLPLSSIVQACWATIQRMLLSVRTMSTYPSLSRQATDNPDHLVEWQRFVSTIVLLIPQTLANACHAAKLQVPLQGTPVYFYPRLVYFAWIRLESAIDGGNAENSLPFTIYPKMLIRQMLQTRRSEYVAQGLMRKSYGSKSYQRRLPNSDHDSERDDNDDDNDMDSLASFLSSIELTPRDMATLVWAVLQYASAQRKTSLSSIASRNRCSNIVTRARRTCNSLFWSSSEEHGEAIIEQLVFSHKASFPGCDERTGSDSELCIRRRRERDHRRWSRLVMETFAPSNASLKNKRDCELSFSKHLGSIAERWSQWTFVQEVEGRQQHHVSLVLWQGLDFLETTSLSLNDLDQRILTMALVNGVSHRLSSTLTTLRLDGMRIAKQLAKGLGQDSLRFDEYNSDDDVISDDDEEIAIVNGQGKNGEGKSVDIKVKNLRQSNQRSRGFVDPDEDYYSEDSDDKKDYQEDDEEVRASKPQNTTEDILTDNEDQDELSVEWEDELIPFDLDDDEDDLRQTPRPLHLLEALDLLRTGENHDHAYSRHEAALDALPTLIKARPDDLTDVAVSLALQLLRLEDKFNIVDFSKKRETAIIMLLVEQPWLVGQSLIEQLFEESGLADKLTIIGCLQNAAFELSGNKAIAGTMVNKSNKPASSKKIGLSTHDYSRNQQVDSQDEQVSRVLSKTRRKRSRNQQKTIKNHFSAIAPMWFYSLIAGFVKHKEDEVLWTGSTGSILLTYFLRCLATIVEFAGVQASQVLSNDLLNLVWDFRTADVAEVRLSVLVAVSTSIAVLSDEKLLALLFGEASIPKEMIEMSRTDPDKDCRSLCKTISSSIHEVLNNNF